MGTRGQQRVYDHRLVRLVRQSGDATLATRLGVPRSTATGWVRRAAAPVVTTPTLDATQLELLVRIARLEQRVRRLTALLRIVFALLHVLRPDLTRLRIPRARDKARLLRAIERSRSVLGLRRVLRIVRLSPSRRAAWQRAAKVCELEDATSCPRSSPQRLTAGEVAAVRAIVTAPEFRHVPTGRLAVLAQRTGRVIASPATWHRLVRERGWRRPRLRVHPAAPREGIRAARPDEVWHVDTTLVRLLDGTPAYVHAVLDNYSRRVLSWRVCERFDPSVTAVLLVEAGRRLDVANGPPMLLADAGVENRNADVDDLVAAGRLRRVLARTEISFSNSLIESWWRSLKHQWLFLHQLDSAATVRKLVAFYVEEHNARIPHAAFDGQTPDEMYLGTGGHVPGELVAARAEARRRRLEIHRAARCGVCVLGRR